ncbi:MAG: tRNA (adenosine(37)-N6)-threonylcarbamoyltransferase complex ATPase subunit type 1 TsaE [Agarilytica sp.]
MASWSTYLENEVATVAVGKRFGHIIRSGAVVYLQGTLGAGKTTFCRGVLSAFGHTGAVKSPTYTLVEPYEFDDAQVHHFDLYRLGDPEELEFLGIRDYFADQNIALVEWPTKGLGYIPAADLCVDLQVEGEGRKLSIESGTARGELLLSSLK